MKVSNVNASVVEVPKSRPTIIGTFEGKSGDAFVENNNQMTLGPKLWKNLFESEEFKRYIKLGMYIGFLGHPEDVGCQDFEHACIVMTDGKYDESTGEVWAKFNLIDTPVGRIVKAFIDAGVQFGISVRGAGDIDANGEVNPDTFVFRGFDLVSFPAYDDAIPTFTAIAADSSVQSQVRYKAICSALNTNLKDVTSSKAVEVLQETVGKTSKQYSVLQRRKDQLEGKSITASVDAQKISGMTKLYSEQVKASAGLRAELASVKADNEALRKENEKLRRQIEASKRIMGEQLRTIHASKDAMERKYLTAISANKRLKGELESVTASVQASDAKYHTMKARYDKLHEDYTINSAKLDAIQASHLNYQQKMNIQERELSSKTETISKLERKLQETVSAATKVEKGTSNLGAKVKQLENEVSACTSIIEGYQNAYAELYASALGVHLSNIPVNAATSVEELRSKINAGTSTCNIPAAPVVMEPSDVISEDDDDGVSIITC